MIPVTVLGQQEAEAARVAGIDTAKGRKKKDRWEAAGMADDMAGEAARGALYGADSEPGEDGEDACKAHADVGVHEGPAQPLMPGQISPQQFQAPYDSPGHAAASPGYQPPNTMPSQASGASAPEGLRHVDLRGSTAMAAEIRPHGPGGER